MTTYERRTERTTVEVRDEGSHPVAYGYAAKFNVLSKNLGGFVERIAPTAFNKTVAEADVLALFNHDMNALLGRRSAGTLRLDIDDVGLRYEVDLPPTTLGRDLAALLERGDVSGSSFGFRAIDDEWGLTDQEFPLRTVKEAALRDVGPVTMPAYSDSTSALRSLADASGYDIKTLAEAAADGRLGDIILPPEEPAEEKAEGREDPTPAVFIPRRFVL